ncbi:TetR/AcrR family transcriptional regulator [Actinoallomurus sp. NPDC050550]|uniref:TetR/AcrR family transcriptional regulator n=1 Tax=Actinoallomurus sp. NPDC050550 TaxID=3154937 RepID=UPI0033E68ED6
MKAPPQRLQYVEQTRQSLLDSAEHLFIAGGYHATSLDAIAEAARFTKGALYRHFANKEAVFTAVVERVQREAVDQIALDDTRTAPSWPGAMAAVAAYLDLTISERFRRIVLEEAPGVLGWVRWRALDEQTTGGVVRHMVERLAQNGVIAPADPAVTSRLICALVAEAALGMATTSDPQAARRTALACIQQLVSGLRA